MSLLPAMVVCQLHEESEQGSDWKDVQLMHESDEVELATSPALVWKALLADVEELHPPFHTESDCLHLRAPNWADLLVCSRCRQRFWWRTRFRIVNFGVATDSVGS